MRKFILLALLFSTRNIYADINFEWELGEIGFDYTNANNQIYAGFNFLRFNWIESNTGIGINFSVFDSFREENDYFITLSPVEIMFTPISFHSIMGVFVNWTVYDRFGYGGYWITEGRKLNNIVGIRVSSTSLPIGRNIRKDNKHFITFSSLFFEYNTTENSFRMGFNMDYAQIFLRGLSLFLSSKDSGE
jgi:hypothetical protein